VYCATLPHQTSIWPSSWPKLSSLSPSTSSSALLTALPNFPRLSSSFPSLRSPSLVACYRIWHIVPIQVVMFLPFAKSV